MTETQRSGKNGPTVGLVQAEEQQVEKLQRELPEWRWVGVPAASPDAVGENDLSAVDAVIVFSQTHAEERARALCSALREQRIMDGTPILVGITIYQMLLGNAVKREVPQSDFIFLPIDPRDLRARLARLQHEDSS